MKSPDRCVHQRATTVFALSLALSLIACGPEDLANSSNTGPSGRVDAGSVLPGKPMGGNSDAGTVAGDPCSLWANVTDNRLLATLHEQLSDRYRPISVMNDLGGNPNRYTTARLQMFTQVERYRAADGRQLVECVYTGTTAVAPANEDPDREQINCEHVMPRARMADKTGSPILYSHMQSDIHNLLPATPGANSSRGSFQFGDVVQDRNLDHSPSVIGKDGAGNTVFEPRPQRKGDIARTVLYFSIRWGTDIGPDEEDALRRWNRIDPPDAREQARNDAVQALQGNRNPLIDCPSLVDRIDDFRYFDSVDTELSLPSP